MVYRDIIGFFGNNFIFPICKICINFRYSAIKYFITAKLVNYMITKKELLQKIAHKEIKSLDQIEKKYLQDDDVLKMYMMTFHQYLLIGSNNIKKKIR